MLDHPKTPMSRSILFLQQGEGKTPSQTDANTLFKATVREKVYFLALIEGFVSFA